MSTGRTQTEAVAAVQLLWKQGSSLHKFSALCNRAQKERAHAQQAAHAAAQPVGPIEIM